MQETNTNVQQVESFSKQMYINIKEPVFCSNENNKLQKSWGKMQQKRFSTANSQFSPNWPTGGRFGPVVAISVYMFLYI